MPNRRSFSSTPLHPDTVNWQSRVNAVGGRIAQKTLMHTDRLIKYCYSVGLRDIAGANHKLKFWLPMATNGFEGLFVPVWHPTANAICVNNNFVAADYSLSSGLQGNGTDKYLDSLVSATVSGNSIYLAVHSSTEGTGATSPMGVYNGSYLSSFLLRYSDGLTYFAHKEAGNILAAVTPSALGFFAGIRIDQTNYMYRNTELLGSTSTPDNSTTTPNLTYYLFARNENNNPGAISARRLCCFFIGDNITPAQHEAFALQQAIWDTAVRT